MSEQDNVQPLTEAELAEIRRMVSTDWPLETAEAWRVARLYATILALQAELQQPNGAQPLDEPELELIEERARRGLDKGQSVINLPPLTVLDILATIRAERTQREQAEAQAASLRAALVPCVGALNRLDALVSAGLPLPIMPRDVEHMAAALMVGRAAIDTTAGTALGNEVDRLRRENRDLREVVQQIASMPDSDYQPGLVSLARVVPMQLLRQARAAITNNAEPQQPQQEGQAEHDARQDAMAGAEDMED